MDETPRGQLPDADRLSVLSATVLLAFAVSPFVNAPGRTFALALPGVVFEFTVSYSAAAAALAGLLAAVGAAWLVESHPNRGGDSAIQHWMLPALTAFVIGVALSAIAVSTQWWVVFGFGGALLTLVFTTEYIAVDPEDARHALATVVLTALSFALFLILAIAVRAAGLRVYLETPALAFASFLVTLRTLHLRSGGKWAFHWAVGITLAVCQAAIGLHYWPISPLRFGLVIVGLSYALNSLAEGIDEGRPWNVVWVEPVVMLAITWGLALGAT